jgi:hypothetical protein
MILNALRLSFLFTETILDPDRGKGASLQSFFTEPGYIGTIDELRAGRAAPLELGLPWPYPVGQHFWDAYLSERHAGDASGKLCFEKLVPLRLPKFLEKIEMVSPGIARVGVEGFYYAHGTGVIVTATVEGDFDTTKAGNLALGLRYDRIFQPNWSGSRGPASLDQLATEALDRLRREGFSTGVTGTRSNLFSIATILRGKDVDPNQPVAPDGDTHRLLNGLANWVRAWQQLTPPPLVAGKTELRIKSATAWPGNVLFAGEHGRAVWFPGLFLKTSQPRHLLSCYHRNLSLASLQAQSLLVLAAAYQGDYPQGMLAPAATQRMAKLAAGLLGRLYGGKNTYRSDSLRAQIGQSAQLQDVNALRQRFGMPSPLQP